MSWSNAWVGLPYRDGGRSREGCDCWGLGWLIYTAERGIALPSYAGAYVTGTEQAEIAALISRERQPDTWQRVATPDPFDLLLFRQGARGSHVGIFVGDGVMLHMAARQQSRHERIDQGRWQARFEGAFRYVKQPLTGAL